MTDEAEHIIERVPQLLWGDMETRTDDLMVASALSLCLDIVGPECSRTYTAGTSGAAFELGWARGMLDAGAGGAVFAHPHHFEPGIAHLFKAIGREHTVVYRTEPDRLWEVAVESLSEDCPVVAAEWQNDHFAILTGYNLSERTFFGRRYVALDEAPDDYVPIPPDHIGHIIVPGPLTEPADPLDAVLGALRFAIASSRTGADTEARGQGGTSHPMIYGPDAFRDHAELVVEGLDPELASYGAREHFLVWRFDVLNSARAYAIRYLREVRPLLSKAARRHLDDAVDAYRTLLGMLAAEGVPGFGVAGPTSESWERVYFGTHDMNLCWDGGRKVEAVRDVLATRENREQFADWLLQLANVEQGAVDALAEIVKTEEGL
jgi:hypothetical protein